MIEQGSGTAFSGTYGRAFEEKEGQRRVAACVQAC